MPANLFISCDWGTSALRLRLVDLHKGVIAYSASDEGVAAVYAQWQASGKDRMQVYGSCLQSHIALLAAQSGKLLDELPVVISGMASSAIGMKELPYLPLPFAADGSDLLYEQLAPSVHLPHPVLLVSGACTLQDVMRGEETQLAGCMEAGTSSGVFLFPGTHSKQVWVKRGVVRHFETFMTGEFFALLSEQSLLANSVAPGEEDHPEAFAEGVEAGRGGNLLHEAFLVRTRHLLDGISPQQNFSYLSGLLIGNELGLLYRKHPGAVTIAASDALAHAYARAWQLLGGGGARVVDAGAAVVHAHAALLRRAGL